MPASLAALAVAVPWLLVHSPVLGLALQRGFALACHQQPERSFVLFGGSVAVCARCLGIYLGAALGLVICVPREFAWRLLLSTAAINLVDWIAELGGLHGNLMLARFALGAALGISAAMLVRASAEEFKIPTRKSTSEHPLTTAQSVRELILPTPDSAMWLGLN
jgi:uncharacterized membrane protein